MKCFVRTTVHNINYIIDQLVTNTRHEVIDISFHWGEPEQAHASVDVWNFVCWSVILEIPLFKAKNRIGHNKI